MSYCAPCERSFRDEAALQNHLRSSSLHKPKRPNHTRPRPAIVSDSALPDGPNIRSPGGLKATNFTNLQTGVQAQPGSPSSYCTECSKQFVNESAFRQHRRTSWVHRPKFNCKDCTKTFPGQRTLDEHMKSSHLPVLRCFDCKRFFPSQQIFDQHLQAPPHVTLACIHCGLEYPSQKLLENHVEYHHSTPYSKTGPPPSLTTWIMHENGRSDGEFPCTTCQPLCERTFNTLEALQNHRQLMIEKLQLSLARRNKNTWSILPETPASIEKLRAMAHSKEVLVKNLYVMEPPSDESIGSQRKCKNCREKYGKLRGRSDALCRHHPNKGRKKWNQSIKKMETYFSCCGKQERCTVLDEHIFEDFETLAQDFEFGKTPSPSPDQQKRKAVALDCEMGTSITNSCELIQLSVVDYFTGEILLDSLVRPKIQMLHYNSKYSGITPQMMRRAIANGDFLESFEGAREELWKWIDSETILVGHSMNHDLNKLHIIHPLIVDSYICVPKLQSSSHSLKNLAKQILGKDVQEGLEGKRGHDCVEDALAARELVIWCSENKAALGARAVQAKEEEEIRLKEIEARRAEKQALEEKKAEELRTQLAASSTSKLEASENKPPDVKAMPPVVFTHEGWLREGNAEVNVKGEEDTKTWETHTVPFSRSSQNTWRWI